MSRSAAWSSGLPLLAAGLLGACASASDSIVQVPMTAPVVATPAVVERLPTGAIFQRGRHDRQLFVTERRPGALGDLVKVDISEKLVAATRGSTDTSRETDLAAKGPGSNGGTGLLSRLMDLDATASGKNSLKGQGKTDAESSFDGQLVASVINVLPNGHLLLAGERITSLGGNLSTLRFSGVVDPDDIRIGNRVSSQDVAQARLELVGAGEVSDANKRHWLNQLLTRTLAIW